MPTPTTGAWGQYIVLCRCCKWCNVESVRAVPSWFFWLLERARSQRACKSSSVADITAAGATQRGCGSPQGSGERSRTPALHSISACPGEVVTGPRSTPRLLKKWFRNYLGSLQAGLCQGSTAGALSLSLNLIKYPFGFFPYSGWDERDIVPLLLCSSGAALLRIITLGVASGMFLFGEKHPGLCAYQGALLHEPRVLPWSKPQSLSGSAALMGFAELTLSDCEISSVIALVHGGINCPSLSQMNVLWGCCYLGESIFMIMTCIVILKWVPIKLPDIIGYNYWHLFSK